ncbi:MAG: aminodeoxychorismate/anthranilate synthase component II [Nitrosopumilaceae archaeon]|nr:aminodeoxychorismate/anthranilate synthase component II [Nitrosopumilaceae archaeon]
MKFLILDNYDSFVYNLAQIFGELNIIINVVRNDQITLKKIKLNNYDAIIISPGPGTVENKKDFGICNQVIYNIGKSIPILGICLGHQGIIKCFGGQINIAKNILHGKTSVIEHYNDPIFNDVSNPFNGTRYNSLIGNKTQIPNTLKIIARSKDDDEIMGISHRKLLIKGIQFHPESIMTTEGKKILKNFVLLVRK